MAFDVARVRAAYPALGEGFAHFDGAGGTQTAAAVVEAVAGAMRAATGNRSTAFLPGRRALDLVAGRGPPSPTCWARNRRAWCSCL